MTRWLLVAGSCGALAWGSFAAADARPRDEAALLAELKKLAQPPEPATLKDKTPEEVRDLQKKRAEVAMALVKEFQDAYPKSPDLNVARAEALAAINGVADEAVAAAGVRLGRALKADAPKGSDLAATADLYLIGTEIRQLFKGVESTEDFRAAWDKNVETIRKQAVAYLAEHPKYRPGADAASGLIRYAEMAHDTTTPRLIREAIAKNLPDHPEARVLAREQAVGKEFDFAFTPLGSEAKTSLKDLRGKVVLVVFWASWCVPCRTELPRMKDRYEKLHKDGFEIVGVNLDEKEEAAKRFLQKAKVSWPQVTGAAARELAEQWGIDSVPVLFVIDRKGKLRSTTAASKLDELLAALMSEKE
jgi:thiol-disulfide isomerase/thioredoxin